MTAPTNTEAIQVDVADVIDNLTNRIKDDAHQIAGLRALAKYQGGEIARLERVVTSLQDDLANNDGVADADPCCTQ